MRIEVDLWFKAEEVPKNLFGHIPKKYRDQYAIDSDGEWCYKKTIGMRFEHYAWFFAFDHHGVDPWQFDKLAEMDQLTSIAYGAGLWDAMEERRPFPYTVDDMKGALMRASMQTNEKIGRAMAEAVWPDWMKSVEPGGEDSGGAKKK